MLNETGSFSRNIHSKRRAPVSYHYWDEPVPIKNLKPESDDPKTDKTPVQTPYKPQPIQYLHPKLWSPPVNRTIQGNLTKQTLSLSLSLSLSPCLLSLSWSSLATAHLQLTARKLESTIG